MWQERLAKNVPRANTTIWSNTRNAKTVRRVNTRSKRAWPPMVVPNAHRGISTPYVPLLMLMLSLWIQTLTVLFFLFIHHHHYYHHPHHPHCHPSPTTFPTSPTEPGLHHLHPQRHQTCPDPDGRPHQHWCRCLHRHWCFIVRAIDLTPIFGCLFDPTSLYFDVFTLLLGTSTTVAKTNAVLSTTIAVQVPLPLAGGEPNHRNPIDRDQPNEPNPASSRRTTATRQQPA